MKKGILTCSLLSLLIFTNSCNGQVKTDLSKDCVSEPKTITDGHPKMIRTQGIVSGNVYCELQDRAGYIWFSTSGEGVYRYDGKLFTNFTTKDGLSDNDVCAIIEDKTGNILFGTKSGICKYDGISFSKYTKDGLICNSVFSVLEDKNGNLWFGTRGFGLSRYDGKTFTNFSE